MKYRLITVACLLAAFTFYIAGHAIGIVAFSAIGVIFETAFWIRLLRHPKPHHA